MRPRRRRHGDEAGLASTQMVLVMPALLALVLVIIQFGVWYHASQLADAAAQEGVRAWRIEGGTQEAGSQRATQVMEAYRDDGDADFLRDYEIQLVDNGDRLRVEVRARSIQVLPGFDFSVKGSAEGHREEFRGE